MAPKGSAAEGRQKGRGNAAGPSGHEPTAAALPSGDGSLQPAGPAKGGRGAETRRRLVMAALDAFGRLGFEAASTRDIAKAAEANLAAIAYHFGSKEALLVAVAEHVVAEVQKHLGARLALAQTLMAGPLDRMTARQMLHGLAEAYIATLLGEAEAERWARFILREQMAPSPAFDTIYGFVHGAHAIVTGLVARLLDLDPRSEEAAARAFTLIGQIVIFRVAQPIVLKRMQWRSVGPRERALILKIVTDQVDRIVGFPLAPEGSA